ncbi:unnamed protein product [Gordionus sp. m RMFG-2023]
MTLNKTDKIHSLIEDIYKNLTEHFLPQNKLLINTGKSYIRTLNASNNAAKSYYETVNKIGQTGAERWGLTKDIGIALMDMSDMHKDLNIQSSMMLKTFNLDSITLLDATLDQETRNVQNEFKKYQVGNKRLKERYEKILSQYRHKMKRRFNKKSTFLRELNMIDSLNENDNPIYGTLSNNIEIGQTKSKTTWQLKEMIKELDEYRIHSLKKAYKTEKDCYTKILNKQFNRIKCLLSETSKVNLLFGPKITEWETNLLLHDNRRYNISAIQMLENNQSIYNNNHNINDIADLLVKENSLLSNNYRSCADLNKILQENLKINDRSYSLYDLTPKNRSINGSCSNYEMSSDYDLHVNLRQAFESNPINLNAVLNDQPIYTSNRNISRPVESLYCPNTNGGINNKHKDGVNESINSPRLYAIAEENKYSNNTRIHGLQGGIGSQSTSSSQSSRRVNMSLQGPNEAAMSTNCGDIDQNITHNYNKEELYGSSEKKLYVKALFSYNPNDYSSAARSADHLDNEVVEDEKNLLHLKREDIIEIVIMSGSFNNNGWRFGRNIQNGNTGWFPISFTVTIELPKNIAPLRPLIYQAPQLFQNSGNYLAPMSYQMHLRNNFRDLRTSELYKETGEGLYNMAGHTLSLSEYDLLNNKINHKMIQQNNLKKQLSTPQISIETTNFIKTSQPTLPNIIYETPYNNKHIKQMIVNDKNHISPVGHELKILRCNGQLNIDARTSFKNKSLENIHKQQHLLLVANNASSLAMSPTNKNATSFDNKSSEETMEEGKNNINGKQIYGKSNKSREMAEVDGNDDLSNSKMAHQELDKRATLFSELKFKLKKREVIINDDIAQTPEPIYDKTKYKKMGHMMDNSKKLNLLKKDHMNDKIPSMPPIPPPLPPANKTLRLTSTNNDKIQDLAIKENTEIEIKDSKIIKNIRYDNQITQAKTPIMQPANVKNITPNKRFSLFSSSKTSKLRL